MKIGIDISQLIYETGVSVYTENLVKSILEIDKKNLYTFFCGTLRRREDFNRFYNLVKNNNTRMLVTPFSPSIADIIWNKIHFMPINLIVGDLDLFHTSDWTEPRFNGIKVTTVHDFAPILFESETNPKIVEVHKRRLELVRKESDKIIVPSISTKNDAIEYGIDEKRIVVIPEAVSANYGKIDKNKIDLVLKKYEISGDYLVTIGVGGRKNTNLLLKAFSRFKKKYKLVIIGGQNHYQVNGELDNVIFTGHVNKDEIPALYSGASAMVYPSLYEGFGLPILEAMNCGVPVVCSNTSSLPEVAGDSAVLIDPKSLESLVDGIEKVLSKRDFYIKSGKNRSMKFKWSDSAGKTIQLYESLV